MRLAGKVALITGAASGIGRGVALAMAKEGASIAINYPYPEERPAAEAVASLIEASGVRAFVVEGDVSNEEDAIRIVASTERWGTGIDVLVNNAGISHTSRLEDFPTKEWDRVVAVHLRGTFLMIRAVLPGMLKRGSGRIINTVSQLAYKGHVGLSAYTAAKAGVIACSRTLALELGSSGVTVNCVAPGATHTPLLDTLPVAFIESLRASIPVGRIADVEDIAPTFVFLASDEARHYQGQCLSPNGGDMFL